MKTSFLIMILAAALGGSSLGKDASLFANFEADFSKHARVEIRGGDGVAASGPIAQRFSLGKGGKKGQLKIRGSITLNGATRSLNETYLFRPPTEEGIQEAALSNLAPGIDDGYSAEDGNFTATARTIRAEIPFVIGTTKGTISLLLRLKRRPKFTELTVTHILSANTLTRPVIWTFRGRTRR